MKILMLAHRLPFPPDKGDRIRSYHELMFLAARHEVWCASFVDSPEQLRFLPAMKSVCREAQAVCIPPVEGKVRGLASLMRGGTITEGYYRSRKMSRLLTDWCHRGAFDAVLAFSSSMASYALRVPAKRRVLDFCDLDSQKWLAYATDSIGPARIAYGMEGLRLAEQETRWIEQFDASVLITEHEAKPLANQAAAGKLLIVGNGIKEVEEHDLAPLPTRPVVGFVGAMDYRPNIEGVEWFCREVWPNILRAEPNAVFQIVGRRPDKRIRRLADIENVEVVGEVADVKPHVDGFRVSVAPLRIARGLQNKVLEAMASARPVVLTSEAACGIPATAGEHFAVENDPHRFAETVIQLLQDDDKAARLGRAGWRYVHQHHCWDRELRQLEAALIGEPSQKEIMAAPVLPATNTAKPLASVAYA